MGPRKVLEAALDSPDPGWEQAWATELERRTAEYERTGEAHSIDEAFDRAMARVRADGSGPSS